MKILVTGAAGYKGCILSRELLSLGHEVSLLDNFMYGYESILDLVPDPNCTVIKQDVRNIKKEDVKDYDIIYHLAGISGYPACEANPHSAQIINVSATKDLVSYLSKDQLLVYASTTSFYGSSGEVKDENSPVSAVSLYGSTKLEGERLSMEKDGSVSFRFATLFGVSRRMRSDLLVNNFVYKAMTERSLVLFDSLSIRTYLHVKDAIRAYLMVLDQYDEMRNEVYNVGSNDLNFSKLDLAKKIQNFFDFKIIDSDLKDFDKRNFVINYDKIYSLGYRPELSMDDGILELHKLYSFYNPSPHYQTI